MEEELLGVCVSVYGMKCLRGKINQRQNDTIPPNVEESLISLMLQEFFNIRYPKKRP